MRMNIGHLKAREVGRILNDNIPIGILPHLCIEILDGEVFLKTEA